MSEMTTVLAPGCSACAGLPKPPFQTLRDCSDCGLFHYCSQECQLLHWPSHKKSCKAIQVIRAKRAANPDKSAPDPADLSHWLGHYQFNLKEACQQALKLYNKAARAMVCDNYVFYLLIYCKGDEAPLEDKFTVMCPSTTPRNWFLPGLDPRALLAEMNSEPISQKHDRTAICLVRCGLYEALVNTESFCFMDEGLDRLVPDLNWKHSFIDRLARRERYLDPTLGPAGAPMMLEPLE